MTSKYHYIICSLRFFTARTVWISLEQVLLSLFQVQCSIKILYSKIVITTTATPILTRFTAKILYTCCTATILYPYVLRPLPHTPFVGYSTTSGVIAVEPVRWRGWLRSPCVWVTRSNRDVSLSSRAATNCVQCRDMSLYLNGITRQCQKVFKYPVWTIQMLYGSQDLYAKKEMKFQNIPG